jgi:hypothetical protein
MGRLLFREVSAEDTAAADFIASAVSLRTTIPIDALQRGLFLSRNSPLAGKSE